MPGGWGTWVNFCWVYAAGLSEPLPHYSGARSRARAKRSSGAPWVSKSTHPRKFGNQVTVHRTNDRPSIRTTGITMFPLTLSSYFGSPGEKWLHINVVINWQLSKPGTCWPVSPDRIACSGVEPSGRVFFEVIRWQISSFQIVAGSIFLKKFIWSMLCLSLWPAL